MDNKAIIERVAKNTGRSNKDVNLLLEAFVNAVKEKSVELDSIAVPGFGTFEPKKKLERIVVNPGTGKKMLVPPKITLTFKPSALLKSKLR